MGLLIMLTITTKKILTISLEWEMHRYLRNNSRVAKECGTYLSILSSTWDSLAVVAGVQGSRSLPG